MRAVPLAAVDSQSIAYQFGEATVVVIIAAVVITALVLANRRRRAEKDAARLGREQQRLEASRLAVPVPGRISYEDGHSEDVQLSLAEVPDVMTKLQGSADTGIELRVPGRGTVLIGIDRGTATITWNSLGSAYRYLSPNVASVNVSDPNGRFRLSIGDAISVINSWATNNSPTTGWERHGTASVTPS